MASQITVLSINTDENTKVPHYSSYVMWILREFPSQKD